MTVKMEVEKTVMFGRREKKTVIARKEKKYTGDKPSKMQAYKDIPIYKWWEE